MSFTYMSILEILLFNLAFILIYQPEFIFSVLRISESTEKKIRGTMTVFGIIALCTLFAWSFYFGATLFVYKRSLM
jgi:hypothetical protein